MLHLATDRDTLGMQHNCLFTNRGKQGLGHEYVIEDVVLNGVELFTHAFILTYRMLNLDMYQ